jgi:hypothetical protein
MRHEQVAELDYCLQLEIPLTSTTFYTIRTQVCKLYLVG